MSNVSEDYSVKNPGVFRLAHRSGVYPFTHDLHPHQYIGESAVNGLEARVRKLEDWAARTEERVIMHLRACEQRGARLERLAWAIGAIVVSILGVLLSPILKLGGG